MSNPIYFKNLSMDCKQKLDGMLTRDTVRTIVFLTGAPAARREKIKSGVELFDLFEERNMTANEVVEILDGQGWRGISRIIKEDLSKIASIPAPQPITIKPKSVSFFQTIAETDVSKQPSYLHSILNRNAEKLMSMPILDKINYYLDCKFEKPEELVIMHPVTEVLFYLAIQLTNISTEFPKIHNLTIVIDDVYMEIFKKVELFRLLGYPDFKSMFDRVVHKSDKLRVIIPRIPSSEALATTLFQDPNLVFRWGDKDVSNKEFLFEQLYELNVGPLTFFKNKEALRDACYKIIADLNAPQAPLLPSKSWQDKLISSINFEFSDQTKDSQYKEKLKKFLVDENITEDILCDVSDEDLKNVGFSELGPRKKIFKAFKEYKP